MPKALKKADARQRKERFSNEELTMLADTLAANADVVFASDMRRPALLRKKEIWAEVAQKVSAVGSTPRTVKDVRKRWDDLRLRVRSILSANRNLAMGTGGGGGSPMKMQEWEETCASTIGIESIEGVGQMERGVATTSDGGSQSDSEELDSATQAPPPKKQAKGKDAGTRPSTSRGTGKSGVAQPSKATHVPTTPRVDTPSDTVVAPTPPTPTTQEPVAEGTLSAANSSVGEAATTAPMSDVEDPCPTPEGQRTPSPQLSSHHSPCNTSNGSIHEVYAADSLAGLLSPVASSPDGGHMQQAAPRRNRGRATDESIRLIRQRQEELNALVGRQVSEAALSREEIRDFSRDMKAAMDSNTTRVCNEMAAVRQVLTRIAEAMESMRHTQGPDQPGTSSSASSDQTSTLRRSSRSLRRPDSQPPNGGSGGGK